MHRTAARLALCAALLLFPAGPRAQTTSAAAPAPLPIEAAATALSGAATGAAST